MENVGPPRVLPGIIEEFGISNIPAGILTALNFESVSIGSLLWVPRGTWL